LDAWEIVVVANKNVPESVPLALYYMNRRGIPAENLLVLSLSDKEQCSRDEYEKKVVLPTRLYLKKRDPLERQFRCIVTTYGVPLVISDPGLDLKEKAKIIDLRQKIRVLHSRMGRIKKNEENKEDKRKSLKEEIDKMEKLINSIKNADKTASLDSEIALVLERDLPLSGWLPNPHFVGYRGKKLKNMPSKAFMVSRLDGPSAKIARRIIDDSLSAEKRGLRGKVYFNARWKDPGDKEVSGYAYYDRSIHRASNYIKKSKVMDVVLKEQLFQPGECPHAALYCGWYSLGKYVDAFTWVTGAVGYHIASIECQTLREPGSTVWCKSMLEKGVAATIGPVGEPYVKAFPPPELFFKLLLDGRLTLVECFALSNPFLSWKMVLIGDPLYRPFRQRESQ
jgi:uncharacterized protein (TIGR03790 family)